MSRETDSSPSGPQGRGGAAYPSGTPPYGSRRYPSLHPSEDGQGEAPEPAGPPQPEEPRTETTLTTRIRINIPGSRPIPPVVMRTPVSDTDAAEGRPDAERTGSTPRPGVPAPSGSDAVTHERGAAAPQVREGGRPDGEAPEGKPAKEKSGSDWFAPRKAPGPESGPGQASGPGTGGGSGQVPAPGGGTGAGPGSGFVPGPGSAPGPVPGPGAGGPAAPQGGSPLPRRDSRPYGSDGPPPGAGAPRRERSGLDALGTDAPGGPAAEPSGPTAGPVTGSSSLTPDLDKIFGPPQTGQTVPRGAAPAPGAPGGVPPRMSDDTAILTPQAPAPAPGPKPGGNVSGDTLTSGVPVVPAEPRPPFPGGPGGGPAAPGRPGSGRPAAPAPEPEPRPAPPARKGRSKLVLLGAGLVVLLGVAYGAGLLMNHSEVPKGTTVLGVDIGGGTKEEAVSRLEAAFGKRVHAPLQLSVDGRKQQLDPEKAGLTLDSQETVRGAAGSDYNPVSVIGSLFGGARPADPVIPVDEEKLGVALADLAGVSSGGNDGTIRFEPNKAVAVPGKPGKGLDVNRSLISVRDAYRAQVETGKASVVELPVTETEPTIGQAELDRAMKEFAEPAMSGLITIKAGPKSIDFGPALSLPKILSMKPVDGRLVEVYDKKAIETLLDGVFDGIMITKGDGKQHQVGADDVAHAMQTALLGKTPAERTVVIDLGGEG
ncbi:hypothetical protein [Streptomyces nitrosporeus]|uniref:hypothetical protein n=1 Tax=Streptomyces nitrosporeus TaxID=28894 RepID=UPI00332F6F66